MQQEHFGRLPQANGTDVRRGVSIVTGCYRSERYIGRLHRSLSQLTRLPLEWIAVVDGRLDGTEALLEGYASVSPFPIKVIVFPKNRGARAAISEGVRQASGEFIMIVDHDDELLADALAVMLDAWEAHDGDRSRLAGVGGRCIDPESGLVIGSPFPTSPCITNEIELRHRLRVTGELAGIVRADLLKRYYLESGDFVTNGLVWQRLARSFDGIYLQRPVRVYHRDNPGSMTLEGIVRNPRGQLEQVIAESNICAPFFFDNPVHFLRQLWHMVRLARHQGLGPIRAMSRLSAIPLRAAYLALWVLTPLQVVRDRRKAITVERPADNSDAV